jgi:NADPH:quinone reductase-like Zn-dependent oxidoreductase
VKKSFGIKNMKAIVYTKYGPADVLQIKKVEKPVPGDNEVLIKVHAASVNSWDWDLLRGKPYLFRLLFGIFRPKHKILGADVAGVVEAVGKGVKKFKPGDEVFGDLCECGWGGFAEFVCAHENSLAVKPESMTFEQAAAIPQAAVMALQGIRDYGKVQPGQKVLINGAGGGVGTFAVQMAKYFGAEVTGVDSRDKLDMLRSIGADQVIDYKEQDFTKNGQHYDLVIDVVANRPIFAYLRSLNPGGIFIMVGGSVASILQAIFLGALISLVGSKKMGILVHNPNKDLADIKKLFESSKVIPVIDRRFPLIETAQALRYLGEGHVRGKVIITVEHEKN